MSVSAVLSAALLVCLEAGASARCPADGSRVHFNRARHSTVFKEVEASGQEMVIYRKGLHGNDVGAHARREYGKPPNVSPNVDKGSTRPHLSQESSQSSRFNRVVDAVPRNAF